MLLVVAAINSSRCSGVAGMGWKYSSPFGPSINTSIVTGFSFLLGFGSSFMRADCFYS